MRKGQKTVISMPCTANDNGACAADSLPVSCHLPANMGIIPGEVELIARYWADIFLGTANDNQPEGKK